MAQVLSYVEWVIHILSGSGQICEKPVADETGVRSSFIVRDDKGGQQYRITIEKI
jgi:hypothetical protein